MTIDSKETKELPIGTKNGCLTIIGGFEEHEQKMELNAQEKVEDLLRQKNEYLTIGKIAPRSETDASILFSALGFDPDPIARLDKEIEGAKNWRSSYKPCYKVQCKCGVIRYVDSFNFSKKRHRFCDAIYDERKHYSTPEVCGLRIKQKERQRQKAERIKDEYYDIAPPYSIHESLEILGFGNDVEEERKNRQKLFFIVKRPYHCKCYLCGKELFFYYTAFEIRNDEYGGYANLGYYSTAHCDCHPISSFQWRTIDILRKNGIKYRVEVTFDDLIGEKGRKPLRYDFGLLSEHGELFMLLECQGEQHYKPVDAYGGGKALVIQKKNDALKREYAFSHGIPLVEIPYTCNTYEKEKTFLRENGVI